MDFYDLWGLAFQTFFACFFPHSLGDMIQFFSSFCSHEMQLEMFPPSFLAAFLTSLRVGELYISIGLQRYSRKGS